MSEQKLDYKAAQEHLSQMPWPPMVQMEEGQDPFALTELDVNWVFCTMLGMKWKDAASVTDITERKFLYNKSMMLAEDVTKERLRLDEKRQQLEEKLDAQLNSLGVQMPEHLKEKDPLATELPNPEDVGEAQLKL